MHTTIIQPLTSPSRLSRARVSQPAAVDHRKPHYELTEHPKRLDLVVYVPGVDSSGVDFDRVEATLQAGVLTIKLPKKLRSTEPAAARALQYVA